MLQLDELHSYHSGNLSLCSHNTFSQESMQLISLSKNAIQAILPSCVISELSLSLSQNKINSKSEFNYGLIQITFNFMQKIMCSNERNLNYSQNSVQFTLSVRYLSSVSKLANVT